MPTPRKSVFGTVAIAKMLGCHQTTVAHWLDSNLIPSYRTVGGHRKVERFHLITFLRNTGTPMPPELLDCDVLCFIHDANLQAALAACLTNQFRRITVEFALNELDALWKLGQLSPRVFVCERFSEKIYACLQSSPHTKSVAISDTPPETGRLEVLFLQKPLDLTLLKKTLDVTLKNS